MTKRKISGLLLLILPIPTLILTLMGFAISSFVLSSLEYSGGGGASTIGSIVSVLLSGLGIVALIGVIVGMPVGIYLLASKGKNETEVKTRTYIFKDPTTVSTLVISALVLGFAMDIIGYIYQRAVLAPDMLNPETMLAGEGFGAMIAISVVGGAITLFFWITLIVWTYRTLSNAYALKVGGMSFTPGWAIGGYLIPIANLVIPFMIIRELWKSAVPSVETSYGTWSKRKGLNWVDMIYGLYILFFIGSAVMGGIISSRMFSDAIASGEPPMMVFPVYFILLTFASTAVLIYMEIKVIRKISEAHMHANNQVSVHNES